jgi:hypothetical protein
MTPKTSISVYCEIKDVVKKDVDLYGLRLDMSLSRIFEYFLKQDIDFLPPVSVESNIKTGPCIHTDTHRSLKEYCSKTGMQITMIVNRVLYWYTKMSDEERKQVITA